MSFRCFPVFVVTAFRVKFPGLRLFLGWLRWQWQQDSRQRERRDPHRRSDAVPRKTVTEPGADHPPPNPQRVSSSLATSTIMAEFLHSKQTSPCATPVWLSLFSVHPLAEFPLVMFPRGPVILAREPVRGMAEEGREAKPLPSEMRLLGGWLMPSPQNVSPAWEPDSFAQVTDIPQVFHGGFHHHRISF